MERGFKPKEVGGLGVLNLIKMNRALIVKWKNYPGVYCEIPIAGTNH